MQDESLRRAQLHADPVLGKYDPLERILSVDDFDTGQHGWAPYFPDYDGWEDYEERYPPVEGLGGILERTRERTIDDRIDRRFPIGPRSIPQISNLPTWDVGTYGSWGSYALKIPTLAVAGSQGVAKKRLGCRWNAKFRVETYFTFKAEASDFRLGETDIEYVSLTFDVHDPDWVRGSGREPRRWWPGVRYHNAEDGDLVQRWMLNTRGSVGTMDGPFDYVADGEQKLGYNRSPTKFQWHYLRFTFDLSRYEYVDLNCNGKELDVAGKRHVFDPPLTGFRASTDKTQGLVLPTFGIRTASDKRAFLYLDSVVISASET